jgi:acetolactate synthase I/II/III large subunit
MRSEATCFAEAGVGHKTASSARVFLATLAAQGVRVAFGIPGGTASPLFEALRSIPELRYVATRHEAGAAFAALGYARATGIPALVLTTSGPGLTNTLTALASAQAEELPMIVVSGEVPLRAFGRGALQDGTSAGWRALDVVRPLTSWCGSLSSPSAARSVAARALLASTGPRPGPVFVAVPLDVGSAAASGGELHMNQPKNVANANATEVRAADLNVAACRLLGRELGRAKRPLLVLGAGARRAGSQAVALSDRIGVPVAVTAHAKGAFPETHPLYLGVLGLGQHPSVDDYLANPPDVSVVIGSGLDDLATNGWSLPLLGTALSFQVDRDVHALGRSLPFSHLIVGDAARVLEMACSCLAADTPQPSPRHRRLTRLPATQARRDRAALEPKRVLGALTEAFSSPVWCCDIGEHLAYALHYLEVDGPDDFHAFLGFGSMGSGIGASIGLQLARPDRQVVCICGDGGFAMMLGELLTCVEQRLGVVYAVMNDGRWNMVEHGFRAVYGAVPNGFVSCVADYAAAATAIGAIGVRLTNSSDLDPAKLRALAAPNRPVVLDVRIDPDQALTPRTRAASISHFCAETE